MWIDVILRTAAVASTIVATLRAGSRVAYLWDHGSIGVMEGPVISVTRNADNETITYHPLFELTEAFRHCVQLSENPHHYENVRRKLRQNSEKDEVLTPTKTRYSFSSSNKFRNLRFDNVTKFGSFAYAFATTTWRKIWRRQMLPFRRNAHYQNNTELRTRGNSMRNESDKEWDWEESVEGQYIYSIDGDSITLGDGTRSKPLSRGTAGRRVANLVEFAPETFRHLRNCAFGISEKSYQDSLLRSGPYVSFQSNSKGAARVGGVFFFSRDGAYMIKSIKVSIKMGRTFFFSYPTQPQSPATLSKPEEVETFLRILPKYHKHMNQHARNSLLTRFCGMYGVKIYDDTSPHKAKAKIHTFVVMNAIFPPESSEIVSERFDLKGSTVGREVSEEEVIKKGNKAVLKDMDLAREVALVRSIRENSVAAHEAGIHIGPAAKAALLSQLRTDVQLLVECQLMDYSLLVGVVRMGNSLQSDQLTRVAIESIKNAAQKYSSQKTLAQRASASIKAGARVMATPALYLGKQAWSLSQLAISWLLSHPLPYYGSDKCGVNGGQLSLIGGTRNGYRALYYLGLIDFLQPWSTRKMVEHQAKGLLGYNTSAISCVDPEKYAQRFLAYLDAHFT